VVIDPACAISPQELLQQLAATPLPPPPPEPEPEPPPALTEEEEGQAYQEAWVTRWSSAA
jgi:hypothetical protein